MKKNKKLVVDMSARLFKCHVIMLIIAMIFTFFFGGFLSIEKPVNGYIFTSVMVLGYGFFLYSESVIEARKNFYNANGRKEELDLLFGFKCGFAAHIPTLVLLAIAAALFYLQNNSYLYFNLAFRFWLLPFISFFPSGDSVHVALYLLYALFPCIVCGISYIFGIRECRTINDI